MECKKKENSQNCSCTATGCERHGVCCDCVMHHRAKRQIPGCFFDKEGEATWDRSFEHFARLVTENRSDS